MSAPFVTTSRDTLAEVLRAKGESNTLTWGPLELTDGTYVALADALIAEGVVVTVESLATDETTLRERIEALVEKWRYKGEFGWGPWQMGDGPDPEGHVLDGCASELRAALGAKP